MRSYNHHVTAPSFDEYLQRKRVTEQRFDESDLSKQFIPYFESGERIRVRMRYGEELSGTVGVTTGWRPAFLLMSRSSARSSSVVLGNEDKIIAVKRGNKYIPLQDR